MLPETAGEVTLGSWCCLRHNTHAPTTSSASAPAAPAMPATIPTLDPLSAAGVVAMMLRETMRAVLSPEGVMLSEGDAAPKVRADTCAAGGGSAFGLLSRRLQRHSQSALCSSTSGTLH